MEPVLLTLLIVVLVATVVVVWISGPKNMEKEKGTLEGVLMCVAGLGLLVLFVQRRKVDKTLPAALFFAGIFFCMLLVLGGAYVIISTRVNDLKISLPKTTQNIIASTLAVVPAALLASSRVNWDWDNTQHLIIDGYKYFSQRLVAGSDYDQFQIIRSLKQYDIEKFEPLINDDNNERQRLLFKQRVGRLKEKFVKIGVSSEYTLFLGLTKDVKEFIKLILFEYGFNTTQNLQTQVTKQFFNDSDIWQTHTAGIREIDVEAKSSETKQENGDIAINVKEKRVFERLLDQAPFPFGAIYVNLVVSFPNELITTWQEQINSRILQTNYSNLNITQKIERELDQTERNILLDLWNNAKLYNTIVAQILAHINQQLSDHSKQAFYLKISVPTEFKVSYSLKPGLEKILENLQTLKTQPTKPTGLVEPAAEREGGTTGAVTEGGTAEAAAVGPVEEREGGTTGAAAEGEDVTTEPAGPAEPAEEERRVDDDDAGKGTGSPAYTTSL
jgi:hypothetical protein